MMINDNHAVNPSVFKTIPYDSFKDFAFIGFVGSAPMVLTVNAQVPARSRQGAGRARQGASPARISYASVGPGSASHLAGELFAAKTGVKHAARALQGRRARDHRPGRRPRQFDVPHRRGRHAADEGRHAGAARDRRAGALRDAARGHDHGGGRYPLEAAYWFGLVAPAGTPPAVLAKLETALAEVLAMPDLRKRMTEMGAVVTPLGSKQFADYIRAETAKWSDVITQNKISSNDGEDAALSE